MPGWSTATRGAAGGYRLARRGDGDLGRRGGRRDRRRYRPDPMLGPCRRMRAHQLLPDPAALGGDQPRGRRGAVGGHARRDDLALRLPAAPAAAHAAAAELTSTADRMSCSARYLETVRALSQRGLQIRLRHRHRERRGAARPQRGHGALHLGQEGRAANGCSNGGSRRSAPGRRWTAPDWAKLNIAPIDYQAATYYSAPKQKPGRNRSTRSIPSCWRPTRSSAFRCASARRWPGVAVDAVFDSVSVATTFKGELGELGIIFCSFGEAVREHPDLVRNYLGTVVPQNDNFFAALNSAVFSDGSFAYIPPGVRCPMELSTYFRINAAKTGQFERTLLIADKGAYVSYLEGCTAPQRDENQLHAAVVELIAHEDAQIKYSTVQNWYPGRRRGQGRHLQFRHQARRLPRRPRRRSRGPRSRPARRSPGNIRAASSKATIRSANSIRSRSPTTASRPIPAPR